MVEDPLFFRQFAFHKKKLIFHRASMAYYREHLNKLGFQVHLVDAFDETAQTGALMQHLHRLGIREIHLTEPDDYLLQRRLNREAGQRGIKLCFYENPGFLMSRAAGSDWLDQNRIHQTSWYIHFRKHLGVLLDAKGKPLGGSWTYDTENRQKLPQGLIAPPLPEISANQPELQMAVQTVARDFPNNPGIMNTWEYPVTHDAAANWLDVFLEQRFRSFGAYQDAMLPGASFLFHSVISPMLNVGLLTPDQVLDRALQAGVEFDIPLPSLEGFVRQVLGWREFVRAVYHERGTQMRKANALNLNAPMPEAMYKGTSTLYPFDESVKRLLKTGYSHHIERLMIQGNLMLLLGINPDAVYRWFMELFIDAYDWVMVPNVYGMSQYADFGGMVTKPYVSGSSYLRKMGHFSQGPWCADWDALYWMFIQQHQEAFRKNPRMAIPVASFMRMSEEKRRGMQETVQQLKRRLEME